jgi:hypothetical protein
MEEMSMKNTLMLVLGGLALVGMNLVSVPAVQADPITLTNDAIVELTDAPGNGKRTTVDVNKRWGSDVGVIKSATEKLQNALNEAGNASGRATHLLQLAVEYGQSAQHKEARLAAQGALLNLCQGANKTDAPCDKVPKFGSYVAP